MKFTTAAAIAGSTIVKGPASSSADHLKILKYNAGGTYNETTLADQVKHAHFAAELKSRVAVSAADIDWPAGGVFTKTLSGIAFYVDGVCVATRSGKTGA